MWRQYGTAAANLPICYGWRYLYVLNAFCLRGETSGRDRSTRFTSMDGLTARIFSATQRTTCGVGGAGSVLPPLY